MSWSLDAIATQFEGLASSYAGDELRRRREEFLVKASENIPLDSAGEFYRFAALALDNTYGVGCRLVDRFFASDSRDKLGEWMSTLGSVQADLNIARHATQIFCESGDVDRAVSLALAFKNVAMRDRILGETVRWVDFDTGMKIANEASPDSRNGVLHQVFVQAFSRESADKPGLVDQLQRLDTVDKNVRSAMVGSLFEAWASTTPADAAHYIDTVLVPSQGTAVSSALTSLVATWVRNDPIGATKWLGERKGVPGWDSAAAIVADSILSSDPDSAVDWAQAITSESVRKQTLEDIFSKWSSFDPESARARREVIDGFQ